jgi:hypothetical protein
LVGLLLLLDFWREGEKVLFRLGKGLVVVLVVEEVMVGSGGWEDSKVVEEIREGDEEEDAAAAAAASFSIASSTSLWASRELPDVPSHLKSMPYCLPNWAKRSSTMGVLGP